MSVDFAPVSTLKPFSKNLNLQLIILQKEDSKTIKDGQQVYQFLAADSSGSIVLSLWNEQGEHLVGGDIIRIFGGYASLFKGSLRLYTSKYGRLVRVGYFTMLFSETPNMSAIIWATDKDGQEDNAASAKNATAPRQQRKKAT